MGTETVNISETFKTNGTTKQFELTDKFESFAKSKGISDQIINSARAEIEVRLNAYNKEEMDDRRFKNVRGIMEDIINSEIGRARSALMEKSRAFQGVRVNTHQSPTPEKIPASVPGITNNTKISVGSIIGAASGGFKDIQAARHRMLANAGGQ